MDPTAALHEAKNAWASGDPGTCLERLMNYFQWRLRGGFEPAGYGPGGWDGFAIELMGTVLEYTTITPDVPEKEVGK